VGILGVSRDLTERKRAEYALRAAHHTLEALIQASPLAICALDPEGQVQMWKGAAEKIFGWKEQEVLGKPLPFVPEEKQEESRKLRERVMCGESLTAVEWTGVKRDGSPIEISLYAAPRHSAQGRALGVMALCADVTERKELEEQFRQAQKMEAVGRLAGGIAHDFNNLLTAIMGYGEILMMDFPQEDPSRKKIDEIVRAAKRAASLTRQLLAFSRKQILQPRTLDLNAVVGDLENMLRRLIGEDIDLSIILDPSLGAVKADPGQIAGYHEPGGQCPGCHAPGRGTDY
jgi:PAS domain S-box-containing protein